jgi:hypothetical protein
MTKKEYKKTIDTFITARYNYLCECASNILKGKKEEYGDLVAELVIYLYNNQDKLDPYISIKMLEGFSVSWLKLQAQYDNTPFMRKYKRNNEEEGTIERISDTTEDVTDDITEDEYIKDLRRIYTDNQVENIMKIHEIYPTLTIPHQILFKAYFMEGLSYDKIKDKYTFFENKNGRKVYYKSKVSIFNLMTDLKNEIKKKL